MGSAIGIVRGTESRNRIFVTQLRQENVRLLARIERLSAEASRLKAEINAMLKDKELLTCSINGGHIHRFSRTNANDTAKANEHEIATSQASFTENVLQMELETLKKENEELIVELEELKARDTSAAGGDIVVCEVKNGAEQCTMKCYNTAAVACQRNKQKPTQVTKCGM